MTKFPHLFLGGFSGLFLSAFLLRRLVTAAPRAIYTHILEPATYTVSHIAQTLLLKWPKPSKLVTFSAKNENKFRSLSIKLSVFSFTYFPVINWITLISYYFSDSFLTFSSSYFSFSLTEIDFPVILPFQFLLQLTELTLVNGHILINVYETTTTTPHPFTGLFPGEPG